MLGESRHVPHQRSAIPGIVRMDVHRPERPELRGAHRRIRSQEATVRRDHLHARDARRRPSEAQGVRQLPTEIESAEEAECLAQGHAPGLPEPNGQRERCFLPEEERRTLAPQVRR